MKKYLDDGSFIATFDTAEEAQKCAESYSSMFTKMVWFDKKINQYVLHIF